MITFVVNESFVATRPCIHVCVLRIRKYLMNASPSTVDAIPYGMLRWNTKILCARLAVAMYMYNIVRIESVNG